ncbi:MAG: hypothetical protein WCN64_12380 [Planctomycetota bacterium]
MGLPYRNYSVQKQAHICQWEIKGRAPPNAVGGLKGSKKVVVDKEK